MVETVTTWLAQFGRDAWPLLQMPSTWLVAAIVLTGGIVRGFSGFGGALIFIPLCASIIGPKKAVAVFYLFDLLSATPYGYAFIRQCNKRELAPLTIAAWCMLPFGAYVLVHANPLHLRWALTVVVLIMLAVLMSGWRYRGTPTAPVSLCVGGFAGFSGGATGISGPIVIAYFLSSRSTPPVIRASIMVFYSLMSTMMSAYFFYKGYFTFDVVVFALIAWPLYLGGLFTGARFFSGSSEGSYRAIAYVLIAASAIIAMPLFDGLIGR